MEGHSIPTPLELKLEELGKQMSILTVIICVLIALLGLFYKYDIWTMLDAGIALAVAAIPEGLPVVATLALAVGTLRMVRAGALIPQLAAVETLGCTTVICVDKTGTLTEIKRQVTDIFADDRQIKLSGSGYDPSSGDITCGGEVYDTKLDAVIQTLLRAAVLCNDATLHNDNNQWTIKGDPTEGALLVAACKAGMEPSELRRLHPRVFEFPFNVASKRMVTINKCDAFGIAAYLKGSPEEIINDSIRVLTRNGLLPLSGELRQQLREVNQTLARQGLRVLAIASKALDPTQSLSAEDLKEGLDLIGLVGMKDTPRPEVEQAIKQCQQAGIRVVMLTGDQPLTAKSVAEELGILD